MDGYAPAVHQHHAAIGSTQEAMASDEPRGFGVVTCCAPGPRDPVEQASAGEQRTPAQLHVSRHGHRARRGVVC